MNDMLLTRRIAEFVIRTRWTDLPATIRHEALRALVNYFAVALAGSGDPDVRRAESLLRRFSAGRQCRVVGRAEPTDALTAATLNAMGANVYDFDDTHVPTIIHPTAPVAAALFALAETRPLSGEQFLLAFVLGVEVECRLGLAVSPDHYRRGWHITSTCGVFGAAAACARVLGLDATRTAWALGNASAQASGLVENLGSMAKSIGVGHAARNGLLSALLAEVDVAGPERPLEGERGFLRVTGEAPDLALAAALGEPWQLSANTYKPYPCGVVLNPVIEACLALRQRWHGPLAQLERIELTGHPLLRQRTDRPGIDSGRQSQVSAQHAVGVVLKTGRAGLAEFSDAAVADPEVRALHGRLAFIDDPARAVDSVRVSLTLASGERLEHEVRAAHGSLAAPLADAELERKLADLAVYGGSGCDPAPLIDALWALERADDASLPMRLATPNH